MMIPPFPSQDLAKLVLGYLAEEQLMTAYDEFLQASPYLDALRNEYDRIFMTSLKIILAEYRAVKIYVETCKPISLRRKLFGCTNLLEVVKYLIQHFDETKLQDNNARASFDIRHSTLNTDLGCGVCNSLKLSKCVCRNKHSHITTPSMSHIEANSLDTSVETTSLEDLPGNQITTRRKQVKVLEKDAKSSSSYEQNVDVCTNLQSEGFSATSIEQNSASNYQNTKARSERENTVLAGNPMAKSIITSQNTVVAESNVHTSETKSCYSNRVSMKGTENKNVTVPDSSTSENVCVQPSVTKESKAIFNECAPSHQNVQGLTKAHLLLKVGNAKNNPVPSSEMDKAVFSHVGTIKPKLNDQKITILSDIKVDSPFNDSNQGKMPTVLRNTSTPVQTILINGTPAYKQDMVQKYSYTKDEIMAMPTIILVPTSKVPLTVPVPTCVQSKKAMQENAITNPTNAPTSDRSLGPLVIDVPSQSPALAKIETGLPDLTEQNDTIDSGLVKAVETKNMSLPKECSDASKSTPVMAGPPVRKSSSTPRRTSHVRVLDFTTPRRILKEPIHEHDENINSTEAINSSNNPNINNLEDIFSNENVVNDNNNGSIIEHTTKNTNDEINDVKKSNNWDADLRALAVANNDGLIRPKSKPRSKSSKKKKLSPVKKKPPNSDSEIKSNSKKVPKNSKRKSVEVVVETKEVIENVVSVPVKPTINIIPGSEWNVTQENELRHEKCINDEEQDETPETERLALQNVIGAGKLNITDLLETPYKQALYDIQMETPRFLGPDLPNEPLSDIKIMNIPTPRFLSTPKVNATPSSVSSRPTDYSSGGSYYKPDDQDYLLIDDLYSIKSSKELSEDPIDTVCNENKAKVTKSRPVRQCTKNISYSNSGILKMKSDDKLEIESSCSETVSTKSLGEEQKEKDAKLKVTTKTQSKTSNRKKNSISKQKKSPSKKETQKPFMKIKPRRPTPTKKTPNRKKTKEKITTAVSLVACVPTKSRRKSSTPRKLHCTKTFNSESSGQDSPDMMLQKPTVTENPEAKRDVIAQDSDVDPPLRWSDDGSQDTKPKDSHSVEIVNESDDIMKIKEYIATSELSKPFKESNLHVDLVKRGFDIETAKIIERDLLDTPPHTNEASLTLIGNITEKKIDDVIVLDNTIESDCNTSGNLEIVQDEESDDEIQLSVSECDEQSVNYIVCHHDNIDNASKREPVKLKDKFTMEICVDDDLTVRLQASQFTSLFELTPEKIDLSDYKETVLAVNSISNIEKLYTPMKDVKAQCYDIFDSTLTSLDTPLKANSPKHTEAVTDIFIEVEKVEVRDIIELKETMELKNRKRVQSCMSEDSIEIDVEKIDTMEKVELKEKVETKKRKRVQSGNMSDDSVESKKAKPEAQYLLASANIQNIDIESVLSRLHGP